MKILLACASGMSTSLLVNKMKEAASEQNIDVEIWAVGQEMVEEEMKKADVLLFGPQMRFLKTKFASKAKELNLPLDVIPPVSYGRCDGKGVLKMAMDMAEKK
ncbi:MAG: PTS sugar transporter subunit IIB [Tyzzerella sp.]|uniref:PTS sugar transporter subunit IIB n=1 Tax=Candidatus Fimicola merdigallinarum TaxID=2840819 RepID=A0A9D9DWE8_9FIRM|nr:PTS sugar transporter subunit IIB [Candidatus Fimicola merdigallinarum]